MSQGSDLKFFPVDGYSDPGRWIVVVSGIERAIGYVLFNDKTHRYEFQFEIETPPDTEPWPSVAETIADFVRQLNLHHDDGPTTVPLKGEVKA